MTTLPTGVPLTALRSHELSDQEFALFRRFFFDEIGISLSEQKKVLVMGRLNRRLNELGLNGFREYYDLIKSADNGGERQRAIDLITTNETYFFREEQHFQHLRERVCAGRGNGPLRIWSAACSTGEEPYSIAMTLHDRLGASGWDVLASDISTRVLAQAERGLFPMERVRGMPPEFLKRYCLRGQGEYEGYLLVDKSLRQRVAFRQLNLMALPPELRDFDAVFLRNVIIYFDAPTKQRVVRAVANTLRKDGWLFLGHSESLFGMDLPLQLVSPSVYRRV